MTDPAFPLYRVTFHFGGGEGTSLDETTSTMRPWLYLTDPGHEAVLAEATRVWPNLNWRGKPRVRRLLKIDVKWKGEVPWALAWFSHQTFRVGRTDEQLHESFERWVQRWEQYQDHLLSAPKDVPCLMGAEDRWRWKAVCACEVCVRDDLAVIAH
jgi:hypothetical protein